MKVKKCLIAAAEGSCSLCGDGTGSVMVFSHQVLLIKQSQKELQWRKRSGWITIFFQSLLTGKVTANQEQYVYLMETKRGFAVDFGQRESVSQSSRLFSIAVQRPKPLMMQPFVLSIGRSSVSLIYWQMVWPLIDRRDEKRQMTISFSDPANSRFSQWHLRDAKSDAVDNMNKG